MVKVKDIEQWLVVFVNEHHGTQSRPLVGLPQDFLKPETVVREVVVYLIFTLIV